MQHYRTSLRIAKLGCHRASVRVINASSLRLGRILAVLLRTFKYVNPEVERWKSGRVILEVNMTHLHVLSCRASPSSPILTDDERKRL